VNGWFRLGKDGYGMGTAEGWLHTFSGLSNKLTQGSISSLLTHRVTDIHIPKGVPLKQKALSTVVSLCLCVMLPLCTFAGDNGYKVKYDGGSITDIKTGATLNLVMAGNQIEFMEKASQIVSIPASDVTEISYGQDVHRRVGAAIGLATLSFGVGALMALTKSKKHFVGITWASGDKKGGLAIQCDKKDYRGILAGLEGVTGKKAVDSDAMTVKN
jgi:hypothetical protein